MTKRKRLTMKLKEAIVGLALPALKGSKVEAQRRRVEELEEAGAEAEKSHRDLVSAIAEAQRLRDLTIANGD